MASMTVGQYCRCRFNHFVAVNKHQDYQRRQYSYDTLNVGQQVEPLIQAIYEKTRSQFENTEALFHAFIDAKAEEKFDEIWDSSVNELNSFCMERRESSNGQHAYSMVNATKEIIDVNTFNNKMEAKYFVALIIISTIAICLLAGLIATLVCFPFPVI